MNDLESNNQPAGGLPIKDSLAHSIGYFTYMDRDEFTVITAAGVLDNLIPGHLVLTNKKLFFYYYSNINREHKFIATYPYIVSAGLKKGLINSTISVSSKKEDFVVSKIKKDQAQKIYEKLNSIISGNKE
jgi:hypothetical protein